MFRYKQYINIELDFSCFERTTNKFHKKHKDISPEIYQRKLTFGINREKEPKVRLLEVYGATHLLLIL